MNAKLETYWGDTLLTKSYGGHANLEIACDSDNLIDPLLLQRLSRNQSTSIDIPRSSLTGTIMIRG